MHHMTMDSGSSLFAIPRKANYREPQTLYRGLDRIQAIVYSIYKQQKFAYAK